MLLLLSAALAATPTLTVVELGTTRGLRPELAWTAVQGVEQALLVCATAPEASGLTELKIVWHVTAAGAPERLWVASATGAPISAAACFVKTLEGVRYGRLTEDGGAMLRFTLQPDGGPGGLIAAKDAFIFTPATAEIDGVGGLSQGGAPLGQGGLGSRGGLGTEGTADGLASLGATTWEPPSRGVALGAEGFETGPYDEATVRGAMKRVVPRWADCYEPYRRKDPYAEGLMVLEVLVEADGTADSARPVKTPSFATTSFTFCALGALTRSEFPPSPTGAAVEVTIPVEFENR